MAFLDGADLAARLLRRPVTPERLRKFVRLCRTRDRWEAALAAIPDATVRDQVRTATEPALRQDVRWPS